TESARDGTIGEVMAYAEDFVHEKGLHGVMNYYFRATILALLNNEISVAQAATNFKRMARRYHYPALLRSWNMLASHDTPRLASVLPHLQQRRFAFALAFLFPGVPLIYYGEEIGMLGGHDPANRAPMVWDPARWDNNLLEFLHSLAELRKNHVSLREGGYVPLPQPAFPTVLAFARVGQQPQETVVVLANASDTLVRGRFFLPLSGMFDSLPLRDLLNPERVVRMESGSFATELREYDVAVLCPMEAKKPRYSFFSGYNNNKLPKGS
ncbi:MAG: alpha-amylase family glycosyl hydrolase, partial [Candidatus Sumerlaeaceae bacterium]|nr:alpha-amylase family glycosyl hydrolase [Candidatus Sumerlaeaceae bacterium]